MTKTRPYKVSNGFVGDVRSHIKMPHEELMFYISFLMLAVILISVWTFVVDCWVNDDVPEIKVGS